MLGIADPHEAGACLFVEGHVVAACTEERLTRLKSDVGYPRRAVEFCLDFAGITPDQLDAVAFASVKAPASHIRIKREATFSVRDYVDEQNLYWKKALAGEPVSYHDLFSNNPKYIKDTAYDYARVFDARGNVDQEAFRQVRAAAVAAHLGIDARKVHFVLHEDSHAFYGYFGSPCRAEALVFTCEGEGDYSNGTVSVMTPAGRRERCHTTGNHLARYYRYITLLLGMKPNQHEYKVMGLAPYASDYEKRKCRPVFDDLLEVRDGNLEPKRRIPDRYFYFIEAFQGCRFDGIAGALQDYLEDRLAAWVSHHVSESGIRNIVFSGGVAQNIKAMKALRDLKDVDEVYVNPISGDGSLALGACYRYLHQRGAVVEPLATAYLGPSFSEKDVRESIERLGIASKYRIVERPSVEHVAALLRDDHVIARCAGRMEFGQRALGNRSILANPATHDNARKINEQIKRRDFWMPFTPTVLDTRAKDYLVNATASPFMTMAFDSTSRARKDLAAAIHPADFTVRPQILTRTANPAYYDLISAFERLTGIGALLNTSFNLHGEPIVCSPDDAFHTFENSELDGVLFDDVLVLR